MSKTLLTEYMGRRLQKLPLKNVFEPRFSTTFIENPYIFSIKPLTPIMLKKKNLEI